MLDLKNPLVLWAITMFFVFYILNHTNLAENYSDGAIGPWSFSTGHKAQATRPEREYMSQQLNPRPTAFWGMW